MSRNNKLTETAKDRWALIGALVLGAVIRFSFIAKASVWHDEGYTMMLAPQSPAQIWLRTGRDVHPPLYYLTLHYWMLLFGQSEAAIRGLSTVFMLGVIAVMFLLVKRLFGSQAARLTALFLAVAPFLIRYSQEARMYGMLAFIASLATYLLIRALDSRKTWDWVWYGVAIAAGLYTYYYVIFLIVFHWAYVAFLAVYPQLSWSSIRKTLLDPKWIAANALAVVLWLPWAPSFYRQITQIQSPPWIPKATLETLPSTYGQFMTFTDIGGKVGSLSLVPLRDADFLVFLIMVAIWLWQYRKKLQPRVLLFLYMALTPAVVWLLSFGAHPKYVDRYMTFAAVAFYVVMAIILIEAWPWQRHRKLQIVTTVILLGTFAVGIRDVYSQANHQMRQLVANLDSHYQTGDLVVSGDFYTFFDSSYYAKQEQLPTTITAYVPNDFPGCCEGRSLLYDQPQLITKNFADLHPSSGRVWIIGKTGDQSYFDNVPANWREVYRWQGGYVATELFDVTTSVSTNPVK